MATVTGTETVRRGSTPGKVGNAVFRGLSTGAGVTIVVLLGLVAGFLLYRAVPALLASREELAGVNFMRGESLLSYVAPLAFGTVLSSAIALAVAVPLAIGIALFISHYAPRRLAQGLGYLIDLLAAIPSVVFGLWGLAFLEPLLKPVFAWLSDNLSWFPLVSGYTGSGKVIATAGLCWRS